MIAPEGRTRSDRATRAGDARSPARRARLSSRRPPGTGPGRRTCGRRGEVGSLGLAGPHHEAHMFMTIGVPSTWAERAVGLEVHVGDLVDRLRQQRRAGALTAGIGEAVVASRLRRAGARGRSTVSAHRRAEVRRVIPCMVEPNRREDPPVPLTPAVLDRRDRREARRPPGGLPHEGPARRRGPRARLRDPHGRRPAASLPAPLHRPLARGDDRRPQGGTAGHGDRDREEGHEAAHAPAPDDGRHHAVRRHRLPRAHVLQPALDGEPVQGRHRARGERHRHAVQGQAPAREPGGRDPARRGRGDRAHRAYHARPPGERGHHDAYDP